MAESLRFAIALYANALAIDFGSEVGYIEGVMGMNGFDGALSGLRLQAVERRLR